jgi:hypothetical protein
MVLFLQRLKMCKRSRLSENLNRSNQCCAQKFLKIITVPLRTSWLKRGNGFSFSEFLLFKIFQITASVVEKVRCEDGRLLACCAL